MTAARLAHLLTGLRADQAAAEGVSGQHQQNRAPWELLKSNSDPHAPVDVKNSDPHTRNLEFSASSLEYSVDIVVAEYSKLDAEVRNVRQKLSSRKMIVVTFPTSLPRYT